MRNICSHSGRLPIALGMLALVCLFATPRAHAQRFQDLFGQTNVIETGYHGVKQCAGGGYIAIGESYCCGTLYASYIARTAANGIPLWNMVYKFGGIDRATDVIELANGDFAICGIADGPNGNCTTSRDVFILRVTAGGVYVAANVYGTRTSDEEAWKIVEAQTGNGVTTNPGDFIVSGSTTNGQVAPNRDGYILRVNPTTLALIWDAQYGGPTNTTDDYFFGVTEVPPTIGGAGDVVATGGTNSWGAGGLDAFTVRVNGNTGAIGAAPQGASVSGTARNDEGQSVVVLSNGPNAGNLVVTGYTNSPAVPSVTDEVLMLQLNANPCFAVGDLAFGDMLGRPDRGFDLKEDANPVPAGSSGVIVTGYTYVGGLGGEDAFLQRVSTACGMTLVGTGMVYGGNGNDEGHSVDNATINNPPTRETPGYILNGFCASPNLLVPGDPQQLYLVKSDVTLSSGCNERVITFTSAANVTTTTCVTPTTGPLGWQCTPFYSAGAFPSFTQLCYAYPRAQDRGGNGNDGNGNAGSGSAGADTPPVIRFEESGESVTSYPNPVKSGSVLNLLFNVKSAVKAHVAVSDIVGRVIYESDVDVVGGSATHLLRTTGWAVGSYMMRVEIGEKSQTTRLVITDR